MNRPKGPARAPAPITTGFLQGLIQSGELNQDRLRPAALVGFRPALEVWSELFEDPPHAIYKRWKPGAPLVENLGTTNDFEMLGAAVVGVTRAALRKAAPGDAKLNQAYEVLLGWSRSPSEPRALQAKRTIGELVPRREVSKNPAVRVLISALGVPGLVNEFNLARDAVWTEYVRQHPEAGGGMKRDWIRHLEEQASREGLAATCNEAAKILPAREIDRALRNAIVGWTLPRPPPPKAGKRSRPKPAR